MNLEEPVIFGPNNGFSAGNKDILLVNSPNTERMLIPVGVFNLLLKCKSFKPAAVHAREQWKKIKLHEKRHLLKTVMDLHSQLFEEVILSYSGFEQMLVGIFNLCAEKGFLVSESEFQKWLNGSASDSSNISSIGVVTRNRPEALNNCLTSYIQNAKTHSREINYLVFDDSPEAAEREKNKEICRGLNKQFGASLFYAGIDEKKEFLRQLEKEGIPASVLQFALFPTHPSYPTYGANRNSYLLHTAGEMTFSVDDDTAGRVGRASNYKEGLKVGVKEVFQELWFFPTREEAFGQIKFLDQDILGFHERVLGKNFGSILKGIGTSSPLDLEESTPFQLGMLNHAQGQVLASFNGLVGDSRLDSPIPTLFSRGAQRDRVLASENSYNMALRSRESIKSVEKLTLDKAGGCMTTFLGMDNRNILPPFFPCFRMEDATFGEMLGMCSRESLFAHIPELLVHSPLTKREHQPQQVSAYEELWPHDVVKAAFQYFLPPTGKPDMGKNIRLAGKHLRHFGTLENWEYREIMTAHKQRALADKISTYEGLLSAYPKSPKFWVNDVKKLLEDSKKVATLEYPLAPHLILAVFEKSEAERQVQQMVSQFGELLAWWPEIIEKTKELREKGIRLGKKIDSF